MAWSEGDWTAYPNGQKVTTFTDNVTMFPGDTSWSIQSVNWNLKSNGTIIETVVQTDTTWILAGVWVKNGNTLTIDTNDVYTISTLSTSNLTLQLSEDDTSTHYWDQMNDTVYFHENTATIKWERNTILPTNTNAKQIETKGKSFFKSFIERRIR